MRAHSEPITFVKGTRVAVVEARRSRRFKVVRRTWLGDAVAEIVHIALIRRRTAHEIGRLHVVGAGAGRAGILRVAQPVGRRTALRSVRKLRVNAGARAIAHVVRTFDQIVRADRAGRLR